jgi:hypothetical protein
MRKAEYIASAFYISEVGTTMVRVPGLLTRFLHLASARLP